MLNIFDELNRIKRDPWKYLGDDVSCANLESFISWYLVWERSFKIKNHDLYNWERFVNFIYNKFRIPNEYCLDFFRIFLQYNNNDVEKCFFYYFKLLDQYFYNEYKWQKYLKENYNSFKKYWIKDYKWKADLYFLIHESNIQMIMKNWLNYENNWYNYFVSKHRFSHITLLTNKELKLEDKGNIFGSDNYKIMKLNTKLFLKDGNQILKNPNWIYFSKAVKSKYIKEYL